MVVSHFISGVICTLHKSRNLHFVLYFLLGWIHSRMGHKKTLCKSNEISLNLSLHGGVCVNTNFFSLE